MIAGQPPFYYNYQNAYNSLLHPSPVHVNNTHIARIFKRYLFQKAISVFKWEMPENWTEPYYVLYCLYEFGKVAIINTNTFGVIPQQCGLEGYGVFYQPTHAVIANPLIEGIHRLKIGTQTVVLQLSPDYGGITDIINIFGDMMCLCLESGSINLLNSRLAYLACADNKSMSESYKKIFDKIIAGEPAVIVEKNLLKQDQSIQDIFQMFNTQVGANFITPEILNVWSTLENMFDTEIGIPSANTEKRERLISAEVKVGSTETYSRVDMWLKLLQKRIQEAKALFGIKNLSVDWRYPPELTGMGGVDNAGVGTTDNNSNVARRQ